MGITRLRVAGVAAVAILSVLAAGASASTFEVTGLVVDATPTHAAPSIHWSPLSGAVAYRVLRDGNRLAEVTTTSFIDSTPMGRYREPLPSTWSTTCCLQPTSPPRRPLTG